MFNFIRTNNLKKINVNDLDDLIGKINLIDIREPYEYKGGSIKGAKNIPMNILINDANNYLKEEEIYYIMCQSGARSSMTSRKLAKKGFDVVDVVGGIGSYVGTKRK